MILGEFDSSALSLIVWSQGVNIGSWQEIKIEIELPHSTRENGQEQFEYLDYNEWVTKKVIIGVGKKLRVNFINCIPQTVLGIAICLKSYMLYNKSRIYLVWSGLYGSYKWCFFRNWFSIVELWITRNLEKISCLYRYMLMEIG